MSLDLQGLFNKIYDSDNQALRVSDSTSAADPVGWGFIHSVDPAVAALAQAVNANRAVYMRAIGAGTITKIGVDVIANSGNVCVGVYSSTGSGLTAAPGTRKATSGSVACPAANTFAEIALGAAVEVEVGDWLAIVLDNGTATVRSANAGLNATNLFRGRCAYQDSAFPLPATATPTVGQIKIPCLIGVP